MRKFSVLLIILFLFGIDTVTNSGAVNPPKRNVILDVDTSGDDLMAILFLLAEPDIDVKAITVVNGVSNVDSGTEMVLRLLSLTGRTGIPVAKGETNPLKGSNSFPAKWQPKVDKPFGLELPPHNLMVSEINASGMIAKVSGAFRGNIYILALGPLTNIARAFEEEPDLVRYVNRIYVSDGAVYVKGAINLEYPAISNTVSGWNQWVDPTAAGIVFSSGVKVELVPLDLTALHSPHPILLKSGLARQYGTMAKGSVNGSLAKLLNNWIAYYHADTQIENAESQAPVWDLVTAEIFVNSDICTEKEDHYIEIMTGDPETAGQIVITDKRDSNVSICLKGNQTLFDTVLFRTAEMAPDPPRGLRTTSPPNENK